MIIADLKLSAGTAMTDGEKLAKAGVGGNLSVRAERVAVLRW